MVGLFIGRCPMLVCFALTELEIFICRFAQRVSRTPISTLLQFFGVYTPLMSDIILGEIRQRIIFMNTRDIVIMIKIFIYYWF